MNQYSDDRKKWIDTTREDFLKIAQKYQDDIVKVIKDKYIRLLDLKDGNIVFSAKNMATLSMMDAQLKKVADLRGDELLKWFYDQVIKNAELNKGYFTEMVGKTGVEKALNAALKQVLMSLGYDGERFIKDSGLYALSRVSDPIRKIKAETIKAISAGVSWANYAESITNLVQKSGVIENHFRTNAYDTFQQVDRKIGFNMATGLGMKYAKFSEGLMTTSRSFCKKNVGKVFTFDEIEAWKDQEWDGKNENYDPVTDVGGYNCTHTLDFITERLAFILRPELKKISV